MNLYEIQKEYRDLINEIESQDGEITDEQFYQLQINKNDLEVKAINYLTVIKVKESETELIDLEIKRLQRLKNSRKKTVSHLKDRLLDAVLQFGEFKIGFNSFSIRKSLAVEVESDKINGLEKEFKTIKVTETPDKKAIKEAILSGQKIEGCELVERKNLKIN